MTRTCLFQLEPQGFVSARVKTGVEMALADAEENVAALARYAGAGKKAVLADLRGVRSQTRDARQYFVGPQAAAVTKMVAILVDSAMSRVVGNFFMGLAEPTMPARLFTDEAAAVRWLEDGQG